MSDRKHRPPFVSVCHPSLAASDWSQALRLRVADSLFDNSTEGICITDDREHIVEVNPTLCQLTGYPKNELLGKTPRVFHSGLQHTMYYEAMWKELLATGQWRGELWNRHKNGNLYAIRLNVSAICNVADKVTHYVGIMADITDTKLHEIELEKNANHDGLTGLPNRILLADRLYQAMAQAQRTNLRLAVCYLDLDGFKPINDAHGHAIGDQVLIEVAKRLNRSVRIGDTVARVGGDEFILLLWGIKEIAECDHILNRVLSEIAAPISSGSLMLDLTVSVGISIFPQDGVEPAELIARADSAMYRSKLAGGHRCSYFFSPENSG